MAPSLDTASLGAPLSGDMPCGEDLDEAGDLDFLNGIAHAESLLPASFFVRDEEGRAQPFDRAGIDFARESKPLLALLDRTKDLRILALLARLAMLDRDLRGFADTLTTIAALLESQWDAVHPQGDGGGYELRCAILQTIEDVSTVLLPLQHGVLAQSRRYGAISFRSVMVADGEVESRGDETAPDRAAIEQALEEADPDDLGYRADALRRSAGAVARIASVTTERGGYASKVGLDRLAVLLDRILGLLDRTGRPADLPATDEEPSAPAPGGVTLLRPLGGIGSTRQAARALAAAALYLRVKEPSSPAEVLVRQARMLVGKSFLDVMRILVPARANDAVVTVGANRGLRLTFDQLSSVPDEAADEPRSDWEDQPNQALDAEGDGDFVATTRGEAVALLKQVGTFFRTHEPSSPIPLLLEKAAGITDRDFLSILREVLPDLASD